MVHDSESYHRGTHAGTRHAGAIDFEQLKKQLLAAMSSHRKLYGQEVTDARALFAAMDHEGSGHITQGEFREALMRLDLTQYGWGVTDQQLEAFTAGMDTDRDGKIDYSEFLHRFGFDDPGPTEAEARIREEQQRLAAAARSHMSDADMEKQMAALDKEIAELETWMADQIKAGTLSPAEETRAKEQLQVLQDRRAELLRFMNAPLHAPDAKSRAVLFESWDSNGNGLLSRAEIDKAVVDHFPEFDHTKGHGGGSLVIAHAQRAADLDEDGWINLHEFGRFIKALVYFNNLWHRFEAIDGELNVELSSVAVSNAKLLQLKTVVAGDGDRRLDLHVRRVAPTIDNSPFNSPCLV